MLTVLDNDKKGLVVGDYLAKWYIKDAAGGYLAPDTDLWIDLMDEVPVLFNDEPVGKRVSYDIDEGGLWVKEWLDKSAKYWRMVQPLLETERLSVRPVTIPGLADHKKGSGYVSFLPVLADALVWTPTLAYKCIGLDQARAAYKSAGMARPVILDELGDLQDDLDRLVFNGKTWDEMALEIKALSADLALILHS